MAREDILKKWEARVAAFRSSGENATRWCKANHVDRHQLYTWMNQPALLRDVVQALQALC
ncbi:IS66 family insertion sequence element accessory protein TnpA [Paenibacillaceae bacterium WGS1546]|uniref:IS66 family insertion sequence element accessory protein TnpA n=1 Tax=Cohnella sp. WGS1546 TaxID=3366810 RepID=UPI00372D318D